MKANAVSWLVVNRASGSSDEGTPEALAKRFAESGHPLARAVVLPDEQPPSRAAIEAGGVDLLAIHAGDGTQNAVITTLYGWSGRVLVLPGGTQNLLAKSLHGEASADQIIAALGNGALQVVRRDLVHSAQGDGLCEILAGPGARWSDVREAMRERDLKEVAATLGEAIGQTSGGAAVRIAEPALGKADGYPAVRLYPDDGALAVDGYDAEGIADVARQGLALLRRDFRDGPHDELGLHPAVVCRSDHPIDLMIDGERKRGGREERFERRECAVDFLALSRQPEAP